MPCSLDPTSSQLATASKLIYTIYTHTHIPTRAPIYTYILLVDTLLHTTYKPQSKPAILFSNHFCKPALFDFHASLAMYTHLFLISLFSLWLGSARCNIVRHPCHSHLSLKEFFFFFLFQLYRVLEARHGLYLPTRGFPRNDGDKRDGEVAKNCPKKKCNIELAENIHYIYLPCSLLSWRVGIGFLGWKFGRFMTDLLGFS